MKGSNMERILLKIMLNAGKIVPVRHLRPVVAKILTNKSKTTYGYDWSCNRLVDPKVAREVIPESLTPEWWNTDPVVLVNRLGLQLSLDLRDNLQRCVYFAGKYEPGTFDFIHSELKKGDTFIDIGAHIGLHSLAAAKRLSKLGGGRVLAFEPTPDSAKNLTENAKRNKINIELYQVGLSKENQKIPMHGDALWGIHDVGVRSLYGDGPIVHWVDVVNFDNWNEQHSLERIDVIKIDAEGAEYDIIYGMKASLLKYKPRCIIMELKDSVIRRTDKTMDDILELMKTLGYGPEGEPVERNQIFRPK